MSSTELAILKNAKDEYLFRILGFYVNMGSVDNIEAVDNVDAVFTLDTIDAVVVVDTVDTMVDIVDDVYTLTYDNITKLTHFQIFKL